MNIKKIAKEISESMYPHLEVGAMDYKKKDRERLVSIVETKLNNNEVLDLVSCIPSIQINQLLKFCEYLEEKDKIKQSYNRLEPKHLVALYIDSIGKR